MGRPRTPAGGPSLGGRRIGAVYLARCHRILLAGCGRQREAQVRWIIAGLAGGEARSKPDRHLTCAPDNDDRGRGSKEGRLSAAAPRQARETFAIGVTFPMAVRRSGVPVACANLRSAT